MTDRRRKRHPCRCSLCEAAAKRPPTLEAGPPTWGKQGFQVRGGVLPRLAIVHRRSFGEIYRQPVFSGPRP
jgi:hypothetical protein